MRGPSRRPKTLAQATDRIPVVPQGTQSSTHASHGKQAATVYDRHWVGFRAANKGHYPETTMASLAGTVSPRQTPPARLVESGPLAQTFSVSPTQSSREIIRAVRILCPRVSAHTKCQPLPLLFIQLAARRLETAFTLDCTARSGVFHMASLSREDRPVPAACSHRGRGRMKGRGRSCSIASLCTGRCNCEGDDFFGGLESDAWSR